MMATALYTDPRTDIASAVAAPNNCPMLKIEVMPSRGKVDARAPHLGDLVITVSRIFEGRDRIKGLVSFLRNLSSTEGS